MVDALRRGLVGAVRSRVERMSWTFVKELYALTLLRVHRMFGFLLGAVSAGGAMYYYVVDEYRVSNELLTEDIYVCWHPSFVRPVSFGVVRMYTL